VSFRRSASRMLTLLVGVGTLWAAQAQAQQVAGTGAVTGVVTNAETGEPLSGVQVVLEGRRLGAVTGQNGRYMITGVPAGTYAVVAQMIGRSIERQEAVRVAADATVAVNFQMRSHALSVEGVVVTGVVDPVAGVKLPFTVGRVTAEQMPVPQVTSPVAALQGRVAGVSVVRGSGQPGSGVSIELRTRTGSVIPTNPLIVVDGVILGANSVDIESLDIESLEVVKGAAAASLYGSRASAGVIQIRTRRGSDVELNRTRITARTEHGVNQLARRVPLTNSHIWQVNAQGQFIDANGNVTTDRASRVPQAIAYMDQPWGIPTYDQLGQFFDAGGFATTNATISQNLGTTNWMASLGNYQEKGVILTNDGLTRNSFRLNLDHRLRDNLSIGVSGYHMRSNRDDLSGSPFWDLLMLPPDVDLLKRGADGNLIHQPDSTLAMENPIWRQTSRDNQSSRMRTLANVNARFQPIHGLTFESDLSYDRSDRSQQQYVPKGTPAVNNLDGLDGSLRYDEAITDQLNASIGATYMRNFAGLTARTTVRGSIEREHDEWFWAQGADFNFRDVPRIGASRTITANSGVEEVKANGFFVNTGLDYLGRYIGDVLIRRDGSSLFGVDARWNTYYRVSAGWRMAEESWWPFQDITEFKINASQGTAGGRPYFSHRFETVSVASSGAITRDNLGNRFLRPEHTTEREYGLTAILRNRYSLQLTHAFQTTEGQLVQIPQPAVSGFFAQWQNSGTVEGRTWEATLEAQLYQSRNLSWSANIIADRNRGRITEWNRPCYQSGVTYRCGGETLGLYYGRKFATSMDELPARWASYADQFQINDEGYVVWVGAGSNPQAANWGTSASLGGRGVLWGHPVLVENEDGQFAQVKIGDRNPDFKVGLGNNVRWRGVSLYGLVDMQVGGQVYNATRQRLYQHDRHANLDQAGKAPEAKKPIQYYHTLYNANNVNSHFVEDGGYIKLRELSARYTLGQNALGTVGLGRLGTERLSLGVIGRNLLTITNFTGFDPEVGNTTLQVDDFGYPNFRTLTAFVEIQF
jgi:TonB-linked SusC/RagA family outer membrane protein